jgi:hypothetical protein
MTIPSWIRPCVLGLLAGALGWWATLYWGFGWMSAQGAQQRADDKARGDVVAVATPYCAFRFTQQANAVSSWQELVKLKGDYNQSQFIENGGWSALPSTITDSGYADEVAMGCAKTLLTLKELNGVALSSLK